MKKIMMAVAIVCVALASQAATVSWKSGTMTDYTGAAPAKGAIAGYLFELTAAEYTAYSTMDAETLSKTLYSDFSGSFATADASGVNKLSKGNASLDLVGTSDYTAPATAYAAVIYFDAANNMAMGNVAMAAVESAVDVNLGGLATTLGGNVTGSGATAWAAVPEPTSGLLMLVGLAGLALRRRRA